ncbi:pyridoxal-5'-phosphate-dependent protein subunit beta [Nanoarchaeota archaeon]
MKGELLPIDKYIVKLRDIIRTWSTEPIVIRDNKIENLDIYNALKTLGLKYVPIGDNNNERISLDNLDPYRDIEEKLSGPKVYNNPLELLEKDIVTPLVKLDYIPGLNIYAKLEWYHPFSLSVKDRTALGLLKDAKERGILDGNKKLLYEATSTNTGIALVSMSRHFNYKTVIYLTKNIPEEIVKLFLVIYGSGVKVTKYNTTVESLGELYEDARRDNAIVLNQFENDANFRMHILTGKEIDYQLRKANIKPDAFVGSLGTSGHASAVSFYLKSRYNIRSYGVQPAKGSHIPGIRRIETGMKWVKYGEFDEIIDITYEEALESIMKVARSTGIFPGISSGAVLSAVEKLYNEGKISGNVIVILPDHGTKYLHQIF